MNIKEHPLIRPFTYFWIKMYGLLSLLFGITLITAISNLKRLTLEEIAIVLLYFSLIHFGVVIHYLWKEIKDKQNISQKEPEPIKYDLGYYNARNLLWTFSVTIPYNLWNKISHSQRDFSKQMNLDTTPCCPHCKTQTIYGIEKISYEAPISGMVNPRTGAQLKQTRYKDREYIKCSNSQCKVKFILYPDSPTSELVSMVGREIANVYETMEQEKFENLMKQIASANSISYR